MRQAVYLVCDLFDFAPNPIQFRLGLGTGLPFFCLDQSVGNTNGRFQVFQLTIKHR